MQPLPSSMLNPFIYLGEEFETLRTCCHPLNLSLGKRVDSVASTSRGGQPEAEGAGHGQHVPGQDRSCISHCPEPSHCSSLSDCALQRDWVLLYRD